jgi:MFS family permease
LIVAITFLTLAAFTTVPSPLYGLYQARDGFSEFMLTVIYAAYAIGVVGALALAGHLSDWYARKRLLIPAAAFTVASAVVFLTWTSVPGLLVARVLSGVSIGLTQSTATAYLAELHARHRPGGIRQPGAGHGDDREHGWARRGGHSLPAARAVGR